MDEPNTEQGTHRSPVPQEPWANIHAKGLFTKQSGRHAPAPRSPALQVGKLYVGSTSLSVGAHTQASSQVCCSRLVPAGTKLSGTHVPRSTPPVEQHEGNVYAGSTGASPFISQIPVDTPVIGS